MLDEEMNEEPVTIYTADPSLRDPLALLRGMFRDLWLGRELAWRLAVRDVSAQYRQTVLGGLWVFVVPLANSLVWIFLGKSGIVVTDSAVVSYPIYVFTGVMLWSVFVDAANAPLQQTIAAAPMLTKINFPREALVVSGVYQTLFHAVIKLSVMLAAIWIAGIRFDGGLILLPFAVLSLVLAGTVLGLFVTPFGVLYGDVGKSFPMLMQFLMFSAPVVFVAPPHGWATTLLELNPLTPLISIARGSLVGTAPQGLGYFAAVNIIALSLLFMTWAAYRMAIPILIERMRS